MQPLPQIPGYELLQRLGGGPLTQVFAAREQATDSACAVKLLRNEFQDDATAVKLLQREARAGLAVNHPHLVHMRYTHVTRTPYFLVMDLLKGESLRRRLRRDYRVDLATTLWVARQTTEALAAVHRGGFVHADVKPDNIRLIDDGTAILIDLGFAHRPGENSNLRRQGYVLGTVNYLAPELCGSDEDAGPASDLFSLGITIFEMLTGQLPYAPGSTDETFRRHRSENPANLRDFATTLPSGLLNLVERLLHRQPADRPGASAVIQQLIGLEIATLRRRKSA